MSDPSRLVPLIARKCLLRNALPLRLFPSSPGPSSLVPCVPRPASRVVGAGRSSRVVVPWGRGLGRGRGLRSGSAVGVCGRGLRSGSAGASSLVAVRVGACGGVVPGPPAGRRLRLGAAVQGGRSPGVRRFGARLQQGLLSPQELDPSVDRCARPSVRPVFLAHHGTNSSTGREQRDERSTEV